MASSYHPNERSFMAVETEIKLRLPQGPEHARNMLEQHGFRAISPRQLEIDQLFDQPTSELRQTGRVLRLRSTGGRWLLTYKGPVEKAMEGQTGHKSREEIETEVSDGPAFEHILRSLGYQPVWCYEKFRTIYKTSGEPGIVAVDETPIGDFMELEGPSYWIDQTAERLGFSARDYVTLSYAALYAEHRQKDQTVPRDMQFHRP
jgi:adenylate cyclase class 2